MAEERDCLGLKPEELKQRMRAFIIGNGCTSPDGTMIHAPTQKVLDICLSIAWSEFRALTTHLRLAREVVRAAEVLMDNSPYDHGDRPYPSPNT